MKRNLWLLMIFVSMLPSVAWAQEEMSTEEELDSTYTDINEHLELFQEELLQLNALCRFRMDIDMEMPLNEPLLDVVSERLKSLSASMNSFSTRWDTYSAAQQVYIADNDSLLNRVAVIQQMRQTVTDTLALRQQQRDHLVAFSTAEKFIWSQDNTYRRLYQQAVQYSMSPKLAAQLEKVKAEEQALTADVQKYYAQAKEAAEAFPGLQLRMKGMDNKVFELQTVSAKIQEMAYKPFIQRIKDYLMGLACVAILLMGLNLLKSKLALVKQAREQAKKMKGMMNGQHNYPTI
ncbi:MAG: hypothetical protein IJ886_01125 [Prevotella sp.]|nr:hypothetical protein [Prevotella sp.]MBR3111280.1 hypothetical protein [Prevotella sp.]